MKHRILQKEMQQMKVSRRQIQQKARMDRKKPGILRNMDCSARKRKIKKIFRSRS